MSYKSLKIWHCIIVMFLLTVGFCFERIIDILRYVFVEHKVLNTLHFWDVVLSLSLLLIVAGSTIFFRNKKILSMSINPGMAFIISILWLGLFASIISNHNPEKHNDLSVCRLLPPLSSVQHVGIIKKAPALNSWDDYKYEYAADEIKINENSINLISHDKTITIENKWGSESIELNSMVFLFGTDEYGRDIFSRVIYGTRLSVLVGISAMIIASLIGLLLGFSAGYSVKFIDNILNRFAEMFLVLPVIFIVILLLALFGNSLLVVIAVLGCSGWMSLFKIVRGEVLSLKGKDFVITSELLGYSKIQILLKEMMPGLISPITVNLIFLFGNVIVAESALSFLGLSAGNNLPTWGAMINEGQYFLGQAWWISFFPCLFLCITLISSNSFARKFRKDYLLISVR